VLNLHLRAVGVALLLASVFIVGYTRHVFVRIGSGRASAGGEAPGVAFFNVAEPALTPWAWIIDLGPLLCALALVGAWLTWRQARSDPAAESLSTPNEDGSEIIGHWLVGWVVGVGGAYLALDWIVRIGLREWTGQDLSILTPSRFLTDLAYPLCVFAGLALAALGRRNAAALAGLIVLGAVYAVWIAAPGRPASLSDDAIASMLWVRGNTPEDVLVLGNHPWLSYLSGREGALMALRQEALSPYTERKRTLLEGGRKAIEAWVEDHQRPVYVRASRVVVDESLELVFERGRERLYRYRPAQP
jgi:hypothetical protein